MPGQHASKVVMELRVHGVRGTPTDSMLGVAPEDVVQVAGDRLTGFYRIADGAHPPLRTLPAGLSLEAYSWGELTSGVRGVLGWVTRVLWLVLLPFALVNLAFWARTQAGEDSGQARWGMRAVRLSAVILTVIAMLTVSFIAIDLVAWQCFRANAIACPVLPDWMDRIAGLSAGARIAVMSLVPLGALLALVALSFQSLARYEAAVHESEVTMTDADRDQSRASILEHPLMWRGEQRTRRLQRLHIAAALSTVVLYTGIHMLVRGGGGWLWPTTSAAALIMALVVLRTMTVDEDDLEYRDEPHLGRLTRRVFPWTGPGRLMRRLPLDALAWTALGVVAAHLAALWTAELSFTQQELAWYGSNLWFIGLFVLLTVVHVIVFVGGRVRLRWTFLVVLGVFALVVSGWFVPAGWLAVETLAAWGLLLLFHRNRSRLAGNRCVAWGGAGASVMLGAATMVALLFTSAGAVAAANFLNGDSQTVADLITVRNERSPVSAQGEPRLVAAGDVRLDGARVVLENGAVRVTHGTVRTDALARESDGVASYATASTMVDKAVLLLPPGTTTVQLVGSCFGRGDDPAYPAQEPCTGESKGFRTAGALDVSPSCILDRALVPCLRVVAADGRVALKVNDPPQTPIVVPQVLVWTPLMLSSMLVLGGLLTAAMVVLYRTKAAPAIRELVGGDSPEVPSQDRDGVTDARVAAGLAHRAERLLDGSGTLTTALALTTLALSSGGRAPWSVYPGLRDVATISLYIALLGSIGLMMAGARVRRSPTARRNVGILWDVTTFWPRAAHPFAPPCYAERVVPEITARARWALGDDPTRAVVLSGHSQGSLICVAVACRLNGRAKQLRLLTYGSQVRAIYGRVFPAAAGPDALGYVPTSGPTRLRAAWPDVPDSRPHGTPAGTGLRFLLARPDHWVNLFRRGDPLGYRVYSDRDHPVYDRPTLEVRPSGSGDPGSLVMTHGGYQHSPEYRAAIARWTGEPVHVPPTDPALAVPLPPA
ncbi:hypothetical protein [Aeromicrobium choanae]|uniref:Lipase (Class 3) n=1 Tax=Aeromicrobium choanae TaxID=1736691 RepID=A0A1T4YSM8_9ACTN|nr:hypothetical protein [Aeromicrobium choanae]SKB04281.1 hypothetical protein SAMN06295964_0524 [Aeromicrobium choanae]